MPIKKASENLIIFILAGLYFFHIVEFMILMPLGPQLMRVLDINAAQFSHLVAVYNFAAAVSGILGLFWMDRWDRKNVLIVVNFFFALGTAICFMATNYVSLLTARIITGAFGGVIGALCMTIIGDIVPFERRGFAMSKLMSAFSLAGISGIPLGLTLAQNFSWQAPFIFITAGSLIFCTLAIFRLPPLTQHMKKVSSTSFRDLIEIISEARHLKCLFFMMLLMFSQFAVIPLISASLVGNGGLKESQLALVYLGFISFTVNSPIRGGGALENFNRSIILETCFIIVL
jgi:predicted MFS family arabinose efflux permease